jgi:GMP synthase-like glutamine amidotransferase
MKKLPYLLTVFSLFVFLFGACTPEKSGEEIEKEEKKNDKTPSGPAISIEVINDMVKSIPSPLEISFLIKDIEIKYDKTVLNAAENSKKYNNDYQRALNLGVYSTDLGYANIYEQTQDALFYLGAVKEMADALKIGQFFDFNTIKKLASTRGNLDTLLLVTTKNLENINDHLQEKKRPDLTILILTGGWLESLYLTCEVTKKQPNELLKTRIGEQKIILEQLLLLLSFYEQKNENIRNLISDFNKLNKIYENVKITYKNEPQVTKEGPNGQLITEGGTTSEIQLTEEDLKAVLETVREIRKKVIG